MARPRVPKKNPDVTPANPTATNNTLPLSDPNTTSAGESSIAVAGAPSAPGNPETRKVRKPEIVKSETRANLVPINVDEEIRRLAYLLSERRGFEPGHEAEDWLSAEREVRQRYRQQSA